MKRTGGDDDGKQRPLRSRRMPLFWEAAFWRVSHSAYTRLMQSKLELDPSWSELSEFLWGYDVETLPVTRFAARV
jgi:hypothetical protein